MNNHKFYIVHVRNDAEEFSQPIIVPGSFLLHKKEENKLYTHYMDPPLNADDLESMKDFVSSYAKPADNWQLFPCTVINVAGNLCKFAFNFFLKHLFELTFVL